MFEAYPDINELITVALLNKPKRYKVAKEIRNLNPNVSLDDLLKLVDIIAEDTDSVEFSELGISLALLLEKMDDNKANEFLEKLLSKDYGGKLIGLILGYTNKKFDKDLVFEITRRLILSEDSETRLAGLNAIRTQYKYLGKDSVIDILAEVFSSDSKAVRKDIPIIILMMKDILDKKTTYEALKRAALEEEEGLLTIIELIKEGILKLSIKELLEIAEIIKMKGNPEIIKLFLDAINKAKIKKKDEILRKLGTLGSTR